MASSERLEAVRGTLSRFRNLSIPFRRGLSRRELRSVDLRADAWLLADALASLSTLGLPRSPAERGRFAVVSRRNRAVLETFASKEDARLALAAVTARRATLAGRFAVVDGRFTDRLDGAMDEPGELPSPPRPHVA